MASNRHDKEIELYRSLLEPPGEYKDGFGWTTVVGILFCGLIMMPGGIYLGLMTGQGLGSAASWVTVILFMEIARRAMKPLKKQNLVILLHAANIMMAGHILFPGGPMGHLVYRAYLSGSEAARDAGMYGAFPKWFCPPPTSEAITQRSFFHQDWLIPIGLAAFMMVLTSIKRFTLGYAFFRLTSDIENLPFPTAPIDAQGALALSEAETDVSEEEDPQPGIRRRAGKKKKTTRWRIFSLGATLGLVFGFIQIGIPAISSLFLSKPFYVIPLPFVDTTLLTEPVLPATPTGMVVDLGALFIGFVLPFWAIMGTMAAIVMTLVLNPILHHFGILHTWQPGMDTINTTYSNSIDFWMSFGIGTGLAIAFVCIYASLRDIRAKYKEIKARRAKEGEDFNIWTTPENRGDYSMKIAFILYIIAASTMVVMCYILLPKAFSILFFLIFFAFFYSPFISYVNARLLGMTGQNVDIPFIKESAFLLSGAKGIEIWLAPIPIENYGSMAKSFRVNELTGVRFWSLIKTELVAMPILFILSLVFWSFIWHSDAVPSDVFPAAQVNWELAAKNQVLLMSSTFVAEDEDPDEKSIKDTEFMKAIHPKVITIGFVACIALYTLLNTLGLPIMLIYGMIRGFGQLPHYMVLEVVGAFIGKLYFQKKFGSVPFLQMAPALTAGYFTGVGLVGMATIAMKLIKSAVSAAPF